MIACTRYCNFFDEINVESASLSRSVKSSLLRLLIQASIKCVLMAKKNKFTIQCIFYSTKLNVKVFHSSEV
jgi:hypothetical protein